MLDLRTYVPAACFWKHHTHATRALFATTLARLLYQQLIVLAVLLSAAVSEGDYRDIRRRPSVGRQRHPLVFRLVEGVDRGISCEYPDRGAIFIPFCTRCRQVFVPGYTQQVGYLLVSGCVFFCHRQLIGFPSVEVVGAGNDYRRLVKGGAPQHPERGVYIGRDRTIGWFSE